ncbi:MAG: PEP-CTERM sorting domain-containing protein, partial [Verrucomicrobiota bacterium]
ILLQFNIIGEVDSSVPYTTTSVLDPNLTLVEGITSNGTTVAGVPSSNPGVSRFQAGYDLGGVPATLSDAIANGNFLSFTIQADSGYQLELNDGTISYTIARPGNAGAVNAAVLTSIGGFSAGQEIDSYALAQEGSPDYNAPIVTTDLPSTGYDAVTAPFEVRIYFFGGSASSSNIAYIRNLEVDGDLAVVPEPSQYAGLAGVMTLLFVALRRRK